MSDVAEGIGGIAEGALAGRAVEPKRGEAGCEESPGICQNCGFAEAYDAFCPQCGQKTHVHRTLSAIAHDLIHGVLHLDGKFWNTLPLLIFKPGQLTRRYIEGERAKFVSPMAMFLFSVFAMFAVFQMVGLTVPSELPEANTGQLERAIEGQTERVETDLQRVEDQLSANDLSADERAELELEQRQLLELQEGLAQANQLPFIGSQETDASGGIPLATQEDDGMNVNLTGIEDLDAGILKKWQENPGLMLYKLQANGYKFSWLLIPLSIPFVWLTFAWKRRFKAYDHAIFVTYSLSFMSLLFIAASLIALIPVGGVFVALMLPLVPPIHLYKQLRGGYELGRFSALWRLIAISGFIWIVLILFLQALLLLGAF